ncbi:GspE/PulE family protein [Thiobaca trueperi]|uniref:Type IV pilus assembly protein PilB n=1 Tax=Thiobaca trueperi TaxID=127458 RepID=A0A4R3N673_9GAMM|nr:ATPase, T2SS/T4P/T4SS family [Thiobaca trueperi]TCT22329.1 type IV pilus assembly protein PilB [Thiobaca trueperi]
MNDQTPDPSASAPAAPVPPQGTGNQIASILLEHGVISGEQLTHARRVRDKLRDDYSLVKVLQELGYLDPRQLREALRTHRQTVPLGNLLVELGYLKPQELRAALEAQQDPEFKGKRLGEILLDKRLIQEYQLIEVLADQLGFPHEEPSFTAIDRELIGQVTPDWCRRFQAVPLRRDGQDVLVVFRNPLDTFARQAAEGAFGSVVAAIGTRRALEEAIKSYDSSRQYARQRPVEVDEADVTRVVDEIILAALEVGASDIHIEPMRQQLRVRLRRDGILMLHKELGLDLAPAITSRLKVLCKADIAEKRRHQGGGFRFDDPQSGRRSDVRASFYVTIFGEKIVLRLLSRKAELLDIKEVGMAPRMLERFLEDALDLPSGVILITGPTGSGKTTTLYGAVNYLNDMEHSIATAEDPVEYVIEGIAQCNLNPKINLTFEETLRHMVRQDPDVIVLGEIRDQFSAESAIQAALTGHKVLTTFHTEDSIGGLLRLMNMQIETFLISSTVVSVLAQRLMRHVCEACAEPYRPNAHELHRLGCAQADLAGARFRHGRGCSACHYTGYAGRVGVFELLVLNEAVKDAILNKRTSSEIRRISVETSGLITLMEDGLAKAAQGMTTVQEVLRHLPRLGKLRPLHEILRLAGELPGR